MTDVSLGAQLEEFVQAQLESGRFRDASEVVRAGLRLLEGQQAERAERLAEIKREIQESIDDPRPSIPAEEVFAELRRENAARRRHGADGA